MEYNEDKEEWAAWQEESKKIKTFLLKEGAVPIEEDEYLTIQKKVFIVPDFGIMKRIQKYLMGNKKPNVIAVGKGIAKKKRQRLNTTNGVYSAYEVNPETGEYTQLKMKNGKRMGRSPEKSWRVGLSRMFKSKRDAEDDRLDV